MKRRRKTPSIQSILNNWKRLANEETLLEIRAYEIEWDRIKNKGKRGDRRRFRQRLKAAAEGTAEGIRVLINIAGLSWNPL